MKLKLLFSFSLFIVLKLFLTQTKIRISAFTITLLIIAICSFQTYSVQAQEMNSGKSFFSEEIRITPNPTNGDVRIYGHMDMVEIYDVLGKKVFETERREFDISALDAGVYLVKVIFNDKGTVKRLIKN